MSKSKRATLNNNIRCNNLLTQQTLRIRAYQSTAGIMTTFSQTEVYNNPRLDARSGSGMVPTTVLVDVAMVLRLEKEPRHKQ